MKMPGGVLAHYLSMLMSKIEDTDEPMYDVAASGELVLKLPGFDDSIKKIKKEAEYFNEMEPLRLAVEYLLLKPGVKIIEYKYSGYGHHEEDLRKAVTYLREKLWPEIPLPEKSPNVEIVAMDIDEWHAARNKLREEEEAKKKHFI